MGDFNSIVWKVEHGSAAFLRTPNGKTVMFDAGCSDDFSPTQYLNQNYGLNRETNRLDKIIISHPDRDHIRDLPNVYELIYPRILVRNNKIPKNEVYPSGTSSLQEPLKAYKSMNEKYIYDIGDGDKNIPVSNWGNVFIETFSCKPEDLSECPKDKMKNNLSLMTYVQYRETEIVFPGDLEPVGWIALLENTNIKDYVGKSNCRILVASHHGRESGICYEEEGKKSVYDDFLNLMQPHLVIISDKWGNETTVPEIYRPYCETYPVYSRSNENTEWKEVLTTKTNDYIRISFTGDMNLPFISVP